MSESRRMRFTLVATILGSTIVFLDSTVVNVALPAISDDLDTGLSGQQWIVEAYLLALVALLLVGGSLGDQFGRKRMFMIGLAGFGITSIACALAPSTGFLIGARAAQGLTGALLVPGSLAILAATFDGETRGKAVGTWTAWSGISTLIGPALGGILIDSVDWRAIFWINVPLIAGTMLLAHRSVEESRDPDADQAIDWTGIFLSAAGLGGPVFALIEQPSRGWESPLVWAPMVAGIAMFAAFILWESRYRHAMLDLSLFKIRNFWVTNLETLVVYAGLLGGFFFITLFLQETVGYNALEAGLATTPVSVLMFGLSPQFGRLAMATGPRLPMSVGPVIGGIGLLLLSRLGTDPTYVTEVLPPLLLFGLGLSMTVAPLTATVLDSVERRHSGIASGVNNGIARVAGLLAIAVLGAVISAQFGSALSDRLPAGLSAGAEARVEAAKEKPFGAADVDGLPAGEAEQISAAATTASSSAFRTGMLLAGGLMIAGGLIAAVGIRNPERRGEHPVTRAVQAGECARCPEPAPEPEPVRA